ncbi:hypothetical protein AB1Y20_016944 [Prymnesium parvum]|uniref:Non-structural maintenance of chromosomes element 4 n=1 Tax=Prymnesium parvum TaxID=97485 RepID=A0AB34ICE5_PRYPA
MLPSPPLHSGGARGSDPSVAVQISKRLANYTKALHLIDALHKRGDDLIDANTARSPKVDDLRRHVELLRGVLEDSPTMALVKERGPRYTFTQMLHDKERPGMLRQLPGTAMVNYFNSACNALLRGGRAGGELASPAGASPSDADDALPPPSPASPPPLPAEAAGGEAKRKGSEEAKEGRAAKRGRGEGAADGSAHGGTAESLVDAARVLTQMGLDRRMASCNERGGESGNAWGGEPCSVLVDARLYGKM